MNGCPLSAVISIFLLLQFLSNIVEFRVWRSVDFFIDFVRFCVCSFLLDKHECIVCVSYDGAEYPQKQRDSIFFAYENV